MGYISENVQNENFEIAYVNKSNESAAKKMSDYFFPPFDRFFRNKSDFLQQTRLNERMKEISNMLSVF